MDQETENQRIPDDVLDGLVRMMVNPAAVVTMDKPTLRALLDAYGRDRARSAS